MQLLDAIIVDDEEKSRRVIRKLLLSGCPEIRVVGDAGSVAEAYSLIHKIKPQLVFLIFADSARPFPLASIAISNSCPL